MPRNARRPPAAPAAAPRGTGQVRIIGGRWRGTKLAVPERPGLRPSSDRVRETLFNWLQPALPGARVLDLFAGSGALGFEAASRGAAEVVLVERDAGLAANLRAQASRLHADTVRVVHAALAWLGGRHEAFDLVFLDPPFADGLWDRALEALVPRLAPGAWIYVESPADIVPAVPPAWALHREGRTREVRYALYRAPGHHAAVTLRPDDPPATTE